MKYEESMAEQLKFRDIKTKCEKYEERRYPVNSGAVLYYDFCTRKRKDCRGSGRTTSKHQSVSEVMHRR